MITQFFSFAPLPTRTPRNSTQFSTSPSITQPSAMRELVEKAHQVPYGDILIQFLDLFRTAFATHVHPFPTMPPCQDPNIVAVSSYDLNTTLSDNVRIN